MERAAHPISVLVYFAFALLASLGAVQAWFDVAVNIYWNRLEALMPRPGDWWFAANVAWALVFTLVALRFAVATAMHERGGAPHRSARWLTGAAAALSPILARDLWLDSQAFSNYGGGCHVQLEFMLPLAYDTAWARPVQEGLAIALVPTVLAAYAGSWCLRRRPNPPNPALQPTPPSRRG